MIRTPTPAKVAPKSLTTIPRDLPGAHLFASAKAKYQDEKQRPRAWQEYECAFTLPPAALTGSAMAIADPLYRNAFELYQRNAPITEQLEAIAEALTYSYGSADVIYLQALMKHAAGSSHYDHLESEAEDFNSAFAGTASKAYILFGYALLTPNGDESPSSSAISALVQGINLFNEVDKHDLVVRFKRYAHALILNAEQLPAYQAKQLRKKAIIVYGALYQLQLTNPKAAILYANAHTAIGILPNYQHALSILQNAWLTASADNRPLLLNAYQEIYTQITTKDFAYATSDSPSPWISSMLATMSVTEHYLHAKMLIALGRYDQALVSLDLAIAKIPNTLTPSEYDDARYQRGLVRYALGKTPDALADLYNVDIKNLSNPAWAYGRSLHCLVRGQGQEALKQLKLAVDYDPKHIDALVMYGQTLRALGHHGDAVTPLQQAMELLLSHKDMIAHPLHKKAARTLAAAYQALKKSAGDAKESKSPDPCLVMAAKYFDLGMQARDKKIETPASAPKAKLGSAIDFEQKMAERTALYQQQTSREHALRCFVLARTVYPEGHKAYAEAGDMYQKLNRPTAALMEYRAGLAKMPTDRELLRNVDLTLGQLGASAQADEIFAAMGNVREEKQSETETSQTSIDRAEELCRTPSVGNYAEALATLRNALKRTAANKVVLLATYRKIYTNIPSDVKITMEKLLFSASCLAHVEILQQIGCYADGLRNIEALVPLLTPLQQAQANYYRHQLGNILDQKDEPPELFQTAAASLADAKDVTSLHLRGKLLLELKQYKEAEICLKQALILQSNNSDLYLDLAEVHYSNQNFSAIEALYKQAEAKAHLTGDVKALSDFGQMLFGAKNYSASMECLLAANKLMLSYANLSGAPHPQHGVVVEIIRQVAFKALPDSKEPDSKKTLRFLATQAEHFLDKGMGILAAAAAPSSPTQPATAETLLKSRNLALHFFDLAKTIHPGCIKAYEKMAEILLLCNKSTKALVIIEEGLSIIAKSPIEEEERAELREGLNQLSVKAHVAIVAPDPSDAESADFDRWVAQKAAVSVGDDSKRGATRAATFLPPTEVSAQPLQVAQTTVGAVTTAALSS
ncbi:hypothetical protein BH10PSE19_BH10PSE19_14160 [soil metagenome]